MSVINFPGQIDEPPEFPPYIPDYEDEDISWQQALFDNCLEFNKRHAMVILSGKHKIMRSGKDAFNREIVEFIAQKELQLMYQNKKIQIGIKANGDPKYTDIVTAWATHNDCDKYEEGVYFCPNAEPLPNWYNTWRGLSVKPVQTTNYDILIPIFRHIDEVICDGKKELSMYLYKWIAYTFQCPDKPAGAALVAQGEKGTGKGTIGHFLMSIWGNHGLHISNPKHLTGQFNGHLADTCFLFADEAFFSGDKSHEGVLKALITESHLMIERKGVDPLLQQNYLKVFMATNSDWAVPASKDERRYCVFQVSNKYRGNREYFNILHKAIKEPEVQAAFLYEMLNMDISDFHTGDIPDSEGLREQRLHSLDSRGQWLIDCIDTAHFDDKNGGVVWENVIDSKVLYNSYLFWCDQQKIGEHGRVSQTALGRYFSKNLGMVKKNLAGRKAWELGDIELFKANFETKEKVSV